MNTLEALKAKAAGKTVQGRPLDGEWIDFDLACIARHYADMEQLYLVRPIEWRLKPEIETVDDYMAIDMTRKRPRPFMLQTTGINDKPNVRFSYEKDTGKLVNVEMIK